MSTNNMFSEDFIPRHGEAISVGPDILRVTCGNTGPFTFTGTNSYIIGREKLAIIDPGPENDEHFKALNRAIDGRIVSHIFVTHTHVDHSPLAALMKQKTGAKIVGAAPHFAARALHLGEINTLEASADHAYEPDEILSDGQIIKGDGWALETIATPGHTANHLAFALEAFLAKVEPVFRFGNATKQKRSGGTGIVFTGDHIMGWSTSIVAPPDGSMSQYMASLDKMLARSDTLYFPGHGGPVENTHKYVRGLKTHRKMRERAIIDRLQKGDETIAQMVREIYRSTDPRLHGAAGLSVFAHLETLIENNIVTCDGPASLDNRFWLKR